MNAHVPTVLLAAALLTATPAAAAPSAAELQASRRAAAVAASPQGAPFRSAGQEYRVVKDLRAIPAGAAAPRGAAATASSEVIERKGPYAVVRGEAGTGRLVAVNLLTGQLGVLTGTVTARVSSASDAAAAARSTGLALELVSTGSGWAFFRAPDGADPLAAAAALSARPGVSGVEAEVKESWDLPE